MRLEEKLDKKTAASSSSKKPTETRNKPSTSAESTSKSSEKKSGPREGCWICKGSHFAQQCPIATDAQKAEAKRRYDEARAKKVKVARIAKPPGPRQVVINEVLEIPFRPDSGADCCFLPEAYLRELQCINPDVQAFNLDRPVPVELAGGKVEYCHYDCTVDLLLGTKAGPVHSLGIDVDGMMEQLADGLVNQDDGDDLGNEPEIGQDAGDFVAKSLEKM
ncbi:hypothetical protein F442_22768, partial [Phytophthora nicotianae P10297]